jgi:hypothetical protein
VIAIDSNILVYAHRRDAVFRQVQPAHSLSFDTVIDAAGDEVAVGGAEAQSRLGFNLCF